MAVVLVVSALAPLFQQNAGTVELPPATATVLPTFPAPPADLNAITFDSVYLHPSGIFSIGQPDGWSASQSNKGATIAQVNLINNTMLTVVDAYVEASATPLTPDQLSDHFSESVIAASWSNFTTWQESSRRLDGDRLSIDFSVTLQGRTFVARQIAWTDGTWIYVVRILVPENATDLLRYLLDRFVESLQPQNEFKGTPFAWEAYYDPAGSHIIRYPSDWQVTDSAPGRPTSITSSDGTLLRVESRADMSIADEAAARSFVENERSGISVISVQPVERGLGQGFSVAYSHTTVDGGKESGLSVLLNAPDGRLHVANLLFPASDIDLNSVESAPSAEATSDATAEPESDPATDTYRRLSEVMSTFYVIEPLNLSAQSLPATATPVPTLALTIAAPTEEATPESASEAPAVEPTAEATPEATAAS